ncbi:protein-disulfide reductase DsbD family protein [Pedobacter sp. SL55]|uniref:protein-disulfide reductase DsbD family protein n=1 Tax=Pedobacter sp. SL55 TaxID=2995161 RepID=UPI00227134DE|nr:cytochrome c biogenesis protein CcdA [Pedobacter sp. SL55]WAC39812.1 thioredoxin family protein [Pedobacter sp. SL55]
MKKYLLYTLVFLLVLTVGQQMVYAQQPDTSGLVFTTIEEDVVDTAVTDTISQDKKKEVLTAGKETNVLTENEAAKPLFSIFLLGFFGGLAALLMPCIFPMLPMTVSFFTKGSKDGNGVAKALFYGASIIVIYVVLGLLVTVLFGADALNDLSTNGIFNFLFFLLLVVFAASFLGAFELTLPSSWVNKMDQKSDKGGMLGIFFMAATLALVSFSCTGPIIGTLLVEAATKGALLGPAVGMFGFSFALAIPFALFAMFPKWMSALPKSGGWLNSVKVVLGLLELAFALKFLSNVDLAYHWGLFDREVFLVLWIAIFGLMALYLLGKVRFSHDSKVSHLSVPRTFIAILTIAFTCYLIPGLWGAPLKAVSAFLPPMATQDFDLSSIEAPSAAHTDTAPRKYGELFEKPKGFNPFFDYDEGMAYAKKVNKPVMIDFTGHACVNCRKMEASVWVDKEVAKVINEDYVLIQLYVDDKTDLAPEEVFTTPKGKEISTIGKKWSYLQTSRFKANSQPYYVLLDQNTEQPIVAPRGADYDINSYLSYLKSGL